MKIRVYKCATFCTKIFSTIQYQPKLVIDGILVPAVKNSESICYLGGHSDFDISNNMHNSELSDSLNAALSEIDLLPLHPRNILLFYSKYLRFKLSWHITVENLPKTWVCEDLYNNVAKYLRKWLELPISTTLSNIVLPYNKFALKIHLPSTTFIKCKIALRNAPRTSPNKDIQALWKSTS